MSEYAYRIEYDSAPMVDRIAAQIQHKVDQAALDKIANTLEQFGYVKVVRCRDCAKWNLFDDIGPVRFGMCCDYAIVNENGFCAWGERKEGVES